MKTTIPCRRPVVKVESATPGPAHGHAVVCKVPGCGHRIVHVVKVAADEEARWHRDAHRAAVPKSRVYQLPAGPNFQNRGYMAECDCGWHRDAPGVTTRSDNEAALAHHLSTEHGLVTCS